MRYLIACVGLLLGLAVEVGAQPPADQPATITQIVTPIAFYPDVLVAQVLAASTHPDDIANAEAWLDGERPWDPRELAQEVDGKPWHPDIKALALTRPVLDALFQNLAWTKALGEAYAHNPMEVLSEVQAVRHKAQVAGELMSSSGQRVTMRGATILLQPVDSRFVYVPGVGVFDVAPSERFVWGWYGWQLSWKDGAVRYRDAPYASRH